MLPVNKDLLALQMKKDRLALNKQLNWLREDKPKPHGKTEKNK